ncbi:MAG: elongation factor 1-beta family protein [Candidatus Marsarchaeota archaeon]|jgi:translation elongation factor EF-1beta|nr:elongation factor 1-beta family protein [Candidatus Marsarchaeota archaeon]MCL5111610.1 elongation factor 1-beta family protein [Candidatus Marsarchaeota archaeon]
MSRVSVIFKVYPKEGAIDETANRIKEQLKPVAIQSEEVAFGIKVIKARFVFDNEKTNSSSIENQIRKIDGVSEIEVEEESLI